MPGELEQELLDETGVDFDHGAINTKSTRSRLD